MPCECDIVNVYDCQSVRQARAHESCTQLISLCS